MKRSHKFNIVLSEAEYAALSDMAKKEGRSRGDWIRQSIALAGPGGTLAGLEAHYGKGAAKRPARPRRAPTPQTKPRSSRQTRSSKRASKAA